MDDKNQQLSIHSYKHDGTLYRRWDKPYILEENDDYLILVNDSTTISNHLNPKTRRTIEPALWFFPKKGWYNFICMPRDNGIFTYINIASNYIIEEGALKYVDYDLDFKIYPNKKWILLDQKEYLANSIKYNYPEKLKKIINITRKQLQTKIIVSGQMANEAYVRELFRKYFGTDETKKERN